MICHNADKQIVVYNKKWTSIRMIIKSGSRSAKAISLIYNEHFQCYTGNVLMSELLLLWTWRSISCSIMETNWSIRYMKYHKKWKLQRKLEATYLSFVIRHLVICYHTFLLCHNRMRMLQILILHPYNIQGKGTNIKENVENRCGSS